MNEAEERIIKPTGKFIPVILNFIEERLDPTLYLIRETNGSLYQTAEQLNRQTHERCEQIQGHLIEKNPPPETNDFMQIFRHNNHLQVQAEEIALRELLDQLELMYPEVPMPESKNDKLPY